MEFEKKAKIMEKSWNFKIPVWKNHGKIFELHAHDPKKFCAARAHSFNDNEIGVVCFIFCGEGVTKRGDVEATVRKVK